MTTNDMIQTGGARLGQAERWHTSGLAQAAVPVRDSSGHVVFSQGDIGAAHVMAHRLLDAGRIALGHQRLAQWLDGRAGAGSEWLHLQFHMAVFELSLGDWHAAYRRFLNEMLPAATVSEDVLTDAPALLWRLALSAPGPMELPWQPLRRTALNSMRHANDSFVELHHLLALAGAGDLASIEQWLSSRGAYAAARSERLVRKMAVALHACARGEYREAATLLERLVPQLRQVGGSRAQNQLFAQLNEWCSRRADDAGFATSYPQAA